MEKNKNTIIVETLINKMFELSGHSTVFADIKDRTDAWYQQWTMTENQNREWVIWGVDYLRKQLKINKRLAEQQMGWFNLNYGLKLQQHEK